VKFLNNLSDASLSTTAFRAAAIVVAVFTVVAAAIMWFVSWQTNRVMTQQVLATLSSEAKLLQAEERQAGLSGLRRAVALRSQNVGSGLYYLGVTGGDKIAGNLSRLPPELVGQASGGVFWYAPDVAGVDRLVRRGTGSHMAVGVPLAFPGLTLIVARDVENQRALSQQIKVVSLLGFGALGILGLLAGFGMSRLVLRRVDQLTDASRAIMAGDLAGRLPRTGSGDEFDRLAENLNEMLARIEQLMHGLREVSDNIAHDLKTPLNRLRNRAEEALRDPRGEAAQRLGLERTIEAADELITTFNALLLIARLEAGAIEETLEDVDINSLVADVAELYEPVAIDAGFGLDVFGGDGSPVVIAVNRQLVGQAVANLIDNAIKYSKIGNSVEDRSRTPCFETVSEDGGDVESGSGRLDSHGHRGDKKIPANISVTVRGTKTGVDISVGDRGPGIGQEDRERVLRRFVRLEKSRTAPGTGLGLSLVAAVARLHRGRVRLEDNEPGLRVVVSLPRR